MPLTNVYTHPCNYHPNQHTEYFHLPRILWPSAVNLPCLNTHIVRGNCCDFCHYWLILPLEFQAHTVYILVVASFRMRCMWLVVHSILLLSSTHYMNRTNLFVQSPVVFCLELLGIKMRFYRHMCSFILVMLGHMFMLNIFLTW